MWTKEPASREELLHVNPSSGYSTLEQLINDYRQSGVESEGHFTLNPSRAKELLKQFQLPEPAHYALHVVSFLIGAGGTRVLIKRTSKGLRFQAPGASISKEAMENPFSVLLRSQAEPYLSELALALNTIIGQEATASLHFEGKRVKYDAQTIEDEEAPGETILTFDCDRRFQEREIPLLIESFVWSPVPVAVEGETISRGRTTPQPEGLEIHLRHGDFPLPIAQNSQNRIFKEVKARFSALISVSRERPVLRIVQLGRDYEKPMPWSFFVPGWQVSLLVSCGAFKKDLSQQAILENETFHNVLASLRTQLELAADLLLTTTPPMIGTENLVDDLVEHLFSQGPEAKELVHQFQLRLQQSLSLAADPLSQAVALFRFGLIGKALGKADAVTAEKTGYDLLMSTRGAEQSEKNWHVLKAQMAFTPENNSLSGRVSAAARDSSLPVALREQCYRWLFKWTNPRTSVRIWDGIDLAKLLLEAGRHSESREQLEVVEGLEATMDSGQTTQFVWLQAEIAAKYGQLQQALALYGRHLTLVRETYGQYSLKLGLTLTKLAIILDHLGQGQQAQEYRAWSKRLYE